MIIFIILILIFVTTIIVIFFVITIFFTILVIIVFAVIPGNGELDLKALARVSGNKRAELVHLKEVLPLTGYIRGGCSPLGAKKNYPVYMDETCILWDEIAISAGQRGMQIVASPADLQKATNATVAALTFE